LEWLNLEATANWLWEISTGNHVDENQRKVLLRMLIDLAKSLRSSLWYYGRWDERINLSAAAYETACILGDWSAAGWRAYDVAFVHLSRARATDAATWAEKSAQAWARGDSNNDKAAGAHLRGLIARQREDYEEAGRLFQETLAIARNAKRESTVVTSLNSLGTLAHKRGDYPTAHSYYVEALELAHKIDDKELEVMCMLNLGSLAIIRQKWGEARSWFEQQLPLAMELTRRDLIGQSQYGLARVAEKEGREDLALPLAEDALKIYERLQHRDLLKVRELVRKLKKAENKSS
jgi:tetratricopeptide (TPR) repeat protein